MAIEDIIIRFLAPLLGVLFGIPFAFWIDRKTREKIKRERAIAVLSALKEEINHNIGLLKQIQAQLTPKSMIYYNMDMNTWRATSLEEFEGIISHKLLRHIYRIYYEYEHISRKIDTQFNMHYSVVRAMNTYLKERQTIVGAILKHAESLEKESEQLIKEIETELASTSKNQRRENVRARDFFYGVLMGVLGNFLVSAVIETARSSGFVEKTLWEVFCITSWIFFFGVFRIIGRQLGFTDRTLGKLRDVTIIGVIFVVFMWALEFYIVPFISSLN